MTRPISPELRLINIRRAKLEYNRRMRALGGRLHGVHAPPPGKQYRIQWTDEGTWDPASRESYRRWEAGGHLLRLDPHSGELVPCSVERWVAPVMDAAGKVIVTPGYWEPVKAAAASPVPLPGMNLVLDNGM